LLGERTGTKKEITILRWAKRQPIYVWVVNMSENVDKAIELLEGSRGCCQAGWMTVSEEKFNAAIALLHAEQSCRPEFQRQIDAIQQ